MNATSDYKSILGHALLAALSQVVLVAMDRLCNDGRCSGAIFLLLLLQFTAIAFHGHILRDYMQRVGEYLALVSFSMVATVLQGYGSYLDLQVNPRITLLYALLIGWIFTLLWFGFVIFNRFFIVSHLSQASPSERPRAQKIQFTIRSLLVATFIVALVAAILRFILLTEEPEYHSFSSTLMLGLLIAGVFFGFIGFVIVMFASAALRREPFARVQTAALTTAIVLVLVFAFSWFGGYARFTDMNWFVLALLICWQIGTVLYLRRHVYTTTTFSRRRNSGGDSLLQPPPPSEIGRL